MARPSRQQRRERRAQQPALAGAGAPPTPPARPTQRSGGSGDEFERRPRTSEQVSQRGGPIRFLQESWGELKKVEWPDQKAVISGTVVVIVACVIVGTYLWLNDRLWSYVVKHLLLH
jgi:preprotein translocase subunit SecE